MGHRHARPLLALTAAVASGAVLAAPAGSALAGPPPASVGTTPGSTVATAPAVPWADAGGLHVVSAAPVDGREWALSVSTPALGGRAVRLRVLLPSDYTGTAAAGTRYPVLYLFHGTSGGPDDWIDAGNAEQTTAGLPLIVVLPDAGFDDNGGGWFTNWWDTSTALGPSQWETFHIDQLVPFVDANLRTIADRSGRAIAGLSQGGFGAFSYAARHPDLFAVAGSFSGAPDLTTDPVIEAGATAVIGATATFLDGAPPDAMFGPHLTQELNWRGHDPARLVSNLADTSLDLYTATGIPGPLDTGTPDPEAMGIEFMTHLSTLGFTAAARRAGVPYYLDDYVFGTHSFPYWARDLADFVPRMMAVFAHPAPAPSAVSYRSVERTWTQWGWRVDSHRDAALAWTWLRGADAHGFTLSGVGSASVTTPADYAAASVHQVQVAGPDGVRLASVTADADGRLHVEVPLAAGRPSTVTVS